MCVVGERNNPRDHMTSSTPLAPASGQLHREAARQDVPVGLKVDQRVPFLPEMQSISHFILENETGISSSRKKVFKLRDPPFDGRTQKLKLITQLFNASNESSFYNEVSSAQYESTYHELECTNPFRATGVGA